jgi:hypothetical protein
MALASGGAHAWQSPLPNALHPAHCAGNRKSSAARNVTIPDHDERGAG